MSKLGYTWYPKDWGTSESVFELSLSERGLYREFIDLAMLNDNTTEIKKDVWVRKFCVSDINLNTILDKLLNLNLIEINDNILFIPSCENRLKLVRGGSNGGKKSKPIHKPNSKPIPKPFESLIEKNAKPTSKQIEIESKYKEKEKENKDYIDSAFLEIFNKWMDYKKQRKESYKTEMSEKSFYNSLIKFSNNNPIIANEIIEQSISNNWAGIFELKNKLTTSNGNKASNGMVY